MLPENATDTHAALAAAASDAGNLLDVLAPPETPALCGLVVDVVSGAGAVAGQLASRDGRCLADLATWHEQLEDLSGEAYVTVTRHTAPYVFTSVSVYGETDDATPVRVWGHLGEDEDAALWLLVGHTPEAGDTVRITIDALRDAAAYLDGEIDAGGSEPVDLDEDTDDDADEDTDDDADGDTDDDADEDTDESADGVA